MKAGKLDRRISIMRQEPSQDEYGFHVPGAPVEVARPWAEVVSASTREFFRAEGVFLNGSVAFRIRWFSGLKLTDHVMWEGRRFEIREIIPLGRNVGLEIRCKGFDA